MKARTVILFVIAKLMFFAITASAAVMSYLPLAYLAYEERGYFAVGGEVLGALIITAIVGWAANIVMKDWFRGMLKLFGKGFLYRSYRRWLPWLSAKRAKRRKINFPKNLKRGKNI